MGIDSFRTANKTDAEAIAQLVNRSYRPELGSHGWPHESDLVSGDRTNAHQVADVISKEGSVILLGLRDSEVVTCIHIEKDGGNCHIGMLTVSPNLQGMGIGEEMLRQAESYAIRF
jgi:ribosomal protein S18 acetylase RimI-like enzyme